MHMYMHVHMYVYAYSGGRLLLFMQEGEAFCWATLGAHMCSSNRDPHWGQKAVVDYALFPTMYHAGAVETMDAAAVWTVAALAARLPKVLIQSDDALLWVVDRGGPMMMG